MRLVTYWQNGELRLGASTTRGVLDVAASARELGVDVPASPTALFEAGVTALAALQSLLTRVEAVKHTAASFHDEDELTLGPCVPAPGKILCVGLNYRRHAEEAGLDTPDTPVLFSKFGNAIAASHEPVVLPPIATQYDYEAELVVVMGARARDVSAELALDHVLGYCNGNDLSARDLQTRSSQWLLGKTLDAFLPIGPYLVTTEEVPNPQELRVRCWLNGDLRQDSSTNDMVFGVSEIVSYVSRYMTLEPGDIIATGTPEGVILGMSEQNWLRPGDEVMVEVGPLGRLVTPLVTRGGTGATIPAPSEQAMGTGVRNA